VEQRILKHIRRVLRPVYPQKEAPEDAVFEKLREYIRDAIQLSILMRMEQSRFVSAFFTMGADFQPSRHSTGGEEQSGRVRMCIFPGIIKQTLFLGASTPADTSVFLARVHLDSVFSYLKLDPLPKAPTGGAGESGAGNGVKERGREHVRENAKDKPEGPS
jgi:hypothetical protein